MKEQSHKNEMRAALQGDFERLRARREDGAETAVAAPPVEHIHEPETAQQVEPVAHEQLVVEPPPPPSSWLDRLRNRR